MSKREMLQDECATYRQALEDIAFPIKALQREAEESGCRLSGNAIVIVENPAYYQGIALEALRKFQSN